MAYTVCCVSIVCGYYVIIPCSSISRSSKALGVSSSDDSPSKNKSGKKSKIVSVYISQLIVTR